MPTDTFSVSADANDGTGAWTGNGSSFSGDESGDPSNAIYCTRVVGGSFEELAFIRWDTSSIGSSSTITSANLKIYIIGSAFSNTDNLNLIGDVYDFGGEPVVNADYASTALTSVITATGIGSLALDAVNTIAFTNLSGISKTGVTGMRLRLGPGTVTGDNFINIAAFEHAQQEPRLEVTYTLPEVGFPVAWIRA